MILATTRNGIYSRCFDYGVCSVPCVEQHFLDIYLLGQQLKINVLPLGRRLSCSGWWFIQCPHIFMCCQLMVDTMQTLVKDWPLPFGLVELMTPLCQAQRHVRLTLLFLLLFIGTSTGTWKRWYSELQPSHTQTHLSLVSWHLLQGNGSGSWCQ